MKSVGAVTAIVVTYNRKELLKRCLEAVLAQSVPLDRVFVVDNGSSDGTIAWLLEWRSLHASQAEIIALPENTGGAGGFRSGMEAALGWEADWLWLMDDDAEPHPDALEQLLLEVDTEANVYGSLAVSGRDTSWPITTGTNPKKKYSLASEVPARFHAESIPFLGFMIHSSLAERIGLPDAGYFIAADDIEYCLRARAAGADLIMVGSSHIEHPKSERFVVNFVFFDLDCLVLSPWKRYYDTRNKLLIARRYYGLRLLTETLPGLVLRWLVYVVTQRQKWGQTKAFFGGMVDGLLGRKGMRHESWGLEP